jgi:hypothetical protein
MRSYILERHFRRGSCRCLHARFITSTSQLATLNGRSPSISRSSAHAAFAKKRAIRATGEPRRSSTLAGRTSSLGCGRRIQASTATTKSGSNTWPSTSTPARRSTPRTRPVSISAPRSTIDPKRTGTSRATTRCSCSIQTGCASKSPALRPESPCPMSNRNLSRGRPSGAPGGQQSGDV